MPTSDSWGKDWLRNYLVALNAEQRIIDVVDVGPGEGTYADLLSGYVGIRWTGIEAWGPYVQEYGLQEKYDNIIVSDARYIRERFITLNDLIIFGDVLEHMGKFSAETLIINCLSTPDSVIVICVPMLHLEQDAVNGNPFERHEMSNHWTDQEMRAMLSLYMTRDMKLDAHVGDVVGYYVVRTGRFAKADVDLGY